MRTDLERRQMARALELELASLPEFSSFGDNNKLAYGAAIAIVKGTSKVSDIFGDDYVMTMTFGANDWLKGDISNDEIIQEEYLQQAQAEISE